MDGIIEGLAARVKALREKSGSGLLPVVAAAVLILVILIFALSGGFRNVGGGAAWTRILGAPVKDQGLLTRMTHSLDSENIPYELRDGNTLYAPDPTAALRARSALIRDDLLPTGLDPWAVFDMERWTATDFERNINLRRAVTAAVKRHIESIADIERAEVAIVMPERVLFSEDQNPVTASVILQTKLGSDFSHNPSKVAGIRKILSFAIEGLSSDNVVITDSDGLLLDDGMVSKRPGQPGTVSSRETMLAEMESRYRTQVLKTLQQIYTADRVRDLTVRIEPEAVGPGGAQGDFGPIVRRIAVSANIDGMWRTVFDEKGKPLVNKRGGIEREYSPVPAAELAQATELVRAAVGFNPGRGDSVTVHNIAFDRTAQFREEDGAYLEKTGKDRLYRIGFIAAAGFALILLLLLVVSLSRARDPKPARTAAPAGTGVPEPFGESGPVSPGNGRGQAGLVDEAVSMAREDPAEVARLIRAWMSGDAES